MPGVTRHWRLRSEAETTALAGRFAEAWRASVATAGARRARACRVALRGALGAGKTTWVRGFVAALGVLDPVPSPTYTLVQRFVSNYGEVLHADFYRLSDASELDALALDEADRPGILWLIEWPDRAGARIADWDLELEFQLADSAHELTAQAISQDGRTWLSQVLD